MWRILERVGLSEETLAEILFYDESYKSRSIPKTHISSPSRLKLFTITSLLLLNNLLKLASLESFSYLKHHSTLIHVPSQILQTFRLIPSKPKHSSSKLQVVSSNFLSITSAKTNPSSLGRTSSSRHFR